MFKSLALGLLSASLWISVSAQTLYVPNGTSGVGISTNGNVGIGTASPQETLHVNGRLLVAGNTEAYIQIQDYAVSGGARWRIMPQTNNSTKLFRIFDEEAWADRLVITSGGNVGIGTTTPGAKLEVHAPAAEAVRIRGDNSYLAFIDNGGTRQGYLQGSTNNMILAAEFGVVAINSGGYERLRVTTTGNVGIGTTNPAHKLAVNGTIRAKEVIVDTGWADYVFAADYRLAPLSEVEQHIQQNGHLPDVPSAADVAERGVSVGEMQKILLRKIEELTLHVIRLEKENASLRADMTVFKTQSSHRN